MNMERLKMLGFRAYPNTAPKLNGYVCRVIELHIFDMPWCCCMYILLRKCAYRKFQHIV